MDAGACGATRPAWSNSSLPRGDGGVTFRALGVSKSTNNIENTSRCILIIDAPSCIPLPIASSSSGCESGTVVYQKGAEHYKNSIAVAQGSPSIPRIEMTQMKLTGNKAASCGMCNDIVISIFRGRVAGLCCQRGSARSSPQFPNNRSGPAVLFWDNLVSQRGR